MIGCICHTTAAGFHGLVRRLWLGGVVVRASDLQSAGCAQGRRQDFRAREVQCEWLQATRGWGVGKGCPPSH